MTELQTEADKTAGQGPSTNSPQWKSRIIFLLIGFVAGAGLLGLIGWQAMPSIWKSPIIFLLIGFVAGAGLLGLIGWQAMPSMMLTVHDSKYSDVDETCEALKTAIEANGWNCPAIRNMNKAMARYGVHFDRPPVRIVELCRADYAERVLTTNPEVSTLMPCAWGVWKGPDGKVYISGMNMGLMGKMFGGVIAEVMGTDVSRDEAKILGQVVR